MAPALTRPAPAPVPGQPAPTPAPVQGEAEDQGAAPQTAGAAAGVTEPGVQAASERTTASVPGATGQDAVDPVASVAVPVRSAGESVPRELPALPEGSEGVRFEAVTTGLVSKRPPYTQQARSTVFLDAASVIWRSATRSCA
ncbi:hypothetical protein GCM10010495_77340 [Kitasatospora herbaricolor]|nr:hypothetical protein GCM10010495_77340 [Kitasatospora herbaricolor]